MLLLVDVRLATAERSNAVVVARLVIANLVASDDSLDFDLVVLTLTLSVLGGRGAGSAERGSKGGQRQ